MKTINNCIILNTVLALYLTVSTINEGGILCAAIRDVDGAAVQKCFALERDIKNLITEARHRISTRRAFFF